MLRGLAMALAVSGGLGGLWLALLSLDPDISYRKDFMQEYLLARALRAGVNPYLTVTELAAEFHLTVPGPLFSHPTPHPPGLALLSWPLAWVDYFWATVVWMVLELTCLAVGIRLLVRWYDPGADWTTTALVTLGSLGAQPVWKGLLLGQSGTLLFALLVLSWMWLRRDRSVLGGGALGLAIALKLTAWPVMIALLAAKRWAGAVVAVAVVAIVHCVALAAMGGRVLADYYLRVAPMVAVLYRASFGNLSPATLGWRLFDGTGTPADFSYRAPPLLPLPALAPLTSYAMTPAILAVAVWQVSRLKDFDARFSVMVAASLLASPIVWDHYLVAAAIPAVVVAGNLRSIGHPGKQTALAGLVSLIILIPSASLSALPEWFAQPAGPRLVVPALVSLVTLLPGFAVFALLMLCAATSRQVARAASPSTVNGR